MVSFAAREPVAFGAKVIEMLQLFEPWSEVPHVFWLRAKSEGFAPASSSLETRSDAVLRLAIVTVLVLPVSPTDTVPKFMEFGLTLIAVRPLPLRLSV